MYMAWASPASTTAPTAAASVGRRRARHPLAPPVFGDYTGIPPLLIQVGEREIIRDDSVRTAAILLCPALPGRPDPAGYLDLLLGGQAVGAQSKACPARAKQSS